MAADTQVQQPLDNQTALKLVNGLFHLLKNYIGNRNQSSVPVLTELEQFLSPHIKFNRNERTVCHHLNDFLFRLKELQKNFEMVQFSHFLEEPIVANNKIVLRYHLDCVKSTGQKKQFHVIAILTVDHGKVTNWTEVLHDKDSGELIPSQEQTD